MYSLGTREKGAVASYSMAWLVSYVFGPKGMAKHEVTHLIGYGVMVFKLIMNHEISMDIISIFKKSKMK